MFGMGSFAGICDSYCLIAYVYIGELKNNWH